MTSWVLGLGILGMSLGFGCAGEAAVSYQGTVTEGTETGYSFDNAPNPSGATPIPGATVVVCIDGCKGNERSVTTSADGSYPELTTTFGGISGDTTIAVQATTLDGRVVAYETVYEDTEDPTVANPSCETPCPPVYLNLQVAP